MCLAQGYNGVMPMRLEPATLQSRDKHSTTEPLHSLWHINENVQPLVACEMATKYSAILFINFHEYIHEFMQ